MKKKLLSVLSVSLIFTLICAIGACAVTPRWSYIGSVDLTIDRNGDEYFTTVACGSNVTKIEVEMELYQKGILGTYSKKASHSETVYSSSAIVADSYDMNPNKTYRMDVTVTVTTSSGQTETAEVSHTV